MRASIRAATLVGSALLISLAIALITVALATVGPSRGADHRDSPSVEGDPAADLADVFAFRSPENSDNLVVAMTVNGLTAPPENATRNFATDVTFVRALGDGGAAQGRVLYIQEERVAVITVEDLAPLPADQTYQVWAISDDTATGIGLFNTAVSGDASTAIQFDLSGVKVVAITVEPAGGSPQPTTEPVLQAEI